MMVEVGKIVTLENNNEYLLLEELLRENVRYVYAVRVKEEAIVTDEYLIFEVQRRNEEDYLSIVDNKVLYDELIDEFRDIIADKILDGALDGVEESE